jgi:OFA family oxalate/formate antiporter-like MFS transporter
VGELSAHRSLEGDLLEEVSIRGWVVVGGCFVSVLIGPTLVSSTFSVFFATLLESTPWSRANIAFAYSLYVLVYGLSGPVVGRMCENLGPKKVFLGGAVLIAGGFALLSMIREVWQFCILYGVLGVTAGMTGVVPVTVLVSRWFVDNRGLALGVAFSGTTGALFLSPLAHALVTSLGWRQAYLLLGIGAGLVLFGAILFAVQDAPLLRADQRPVTQPAPRQVGGGFTLREALWTQAFWLLAGAGLLFFGALTAMFAHVIPLALDKGLAKSLAVLSLGVMIAMGTVGKVGMGYIADRYEAGKVLLWTFLIQAAALLLVAWEEGAALFWIFVVLFGIAQGGALTLVPMVLGNLFGSGVLGSLVGTYWLIATVGSLVGPPGAGALRDATGTYFLVLILFAAELSCAALLAGLVRSERLAVV